MEVATRRVAAAAEEAEMLRTVLASRDEELARLHSSLVEKNRTTEQMATKLLDYKTRVDTMEIQLRKYFVKKINRFMPNSDAQACCMRSLVARVRSAARRQWERGGDGGHMPFPCGVYLLRFHVCVCV